MKKKKKNPIPLFIVFALLIYAADYFIAWAVLTVIAWVMGLTVSWLVVGAAGFAILVLQLLVAAG